MSRAYPQVRFRSPPELQEKIAQSAAENRRSLNSEIVLILERHFEEKKASSPAVGSKPDASHAE